MEHSKLKELVLSNKNKSYSPYSKFRVSAVLVSKDGKIYTGVNIENSSYGLTVCAERTAILKAVSDGIKEFEKIYLAGDSDDFLTPCGACRQVLIEFCKKEFQVISVKNDLSERIYTLEELLPHSFNKDFLE